MEYHYHQMIEELAKKGSSPGLEQIQALLDELGHPEEKINVIHIAGTNGKGSVFAFLASILQESGYRVGRYISPTIRCYEERFQIDGKFIEPERLECYYARMEQALLSMESKSLEKPRIQGDEKKEEETEAGDGEGTKDNAVGSCLSKRPTGPTLFEVETALAFLYFAEETVDFALIETGMGGRLDATNVVEHPLLTVISSISFDHKAFLGNTLTEIAGEKAGIIKENVPVILEENVLEVCKVIKEVALEKQAPLIQICPDDYEVLVETETGSSFIWKEYRFETDLPGRHQIANAVTALAVADALQKMMSENTVCFANDVEQSSFFGNRQKDTAVQSVSEKEKEKKQEESRGKKITLFTMLAGIHKTSWPGRLELLQKRPLLYRDGAHNPDGARKLADFLQKHFTNRKIIYIMGVLKDKEYEEMLACLMPLAKRVYVFRPQNARGLPGEILLEAVRTFDVPGECCRNVNEALRKALRDAQQDARQDDVLVVCGSLSFMEEMEEAIWK
ncbi:MAG: bifunctional folylpolyglutamate synthase/dihydrofolate synthase [Clostridiales bacterium]|nr:bifunctional folylpolyglutamate synthase/dihydrofolate synthase [Clostridiales bacterium]